MMVTVAWPPFSATEKIPGVRELSISEKDSSSSATLSSMMTTEKQRESPSELPAVKTKFALTGRKSDCSVVRQNNNN